MTGGHRKIRKENFRFDIYANKTLLPTYVVDTPDGEIRLSGTFWRGAKANFLPLKEAMRKDSAIDDHILEGCAPKSPFIKQDMKITSFGSCFAHHVGHYLDQRGYTVMGKDLPHQAHIIRFADGMVTTFSMLQQLEWAIENKEVSDKLWFDKDKNLVPVDGKIREETYKIIQETEVFIFTLGLTETWYNKITGEPLWRAVPIEYFDEDVYGFRASGFQENYENLMKMRALIRQVRPMAPIIFTLSPVPLQATFRPMGCVTASAASKAILRAALDQLLQDFEADENLFYFPSYEIVKEFYVDPYEDDNRHPRMEVISSIMNVFERYYCAGENAPDAPFEYRGVR